MAPWVLHVRIERIPVGEPDQVHLVGQRRILAGERPATCEHAGTVVRQQRQHGVFVGERAFSGGRVGVSNERELIGTL